MSQQHTSFEIDDTGAETSGLLAAGSSSQRNWFARTRMALPAWLGGPPSIAAFQPVPTSEAFEDQGEAVSPSYHPTYHHPYRNYPSERWCPEENAGFLSRLMFLWVGGLLSLGAKKSLEHDDLWDVALEDEASWVSNKFQMELQATADDFEAPRGKIGKAMWKTHGKAFIYAGVVKLVHDIVMFAGPFLLEVLLKHVQAGGGAWEGFGLACALAGAAILETLTVNVYFHTLFRICLHLKTELVDVLYSKSLRVSSAAKAEMGAGAVVNLQSNDAAKLWSLPQYLHMIWSGPMQIFAVMALLVRIINLVPALVGLGVTIALIPLSALVARALAKVRKRVVALTDARVKLCSEVITGIKAIKLYAWEQPYKERISALREKELAEIRKSALIGTWNNILWQGGPIVISMAAFLSYSAMGYPLTAAVAFPALSLFNLLRFPVMMFPTQLMNIVNAKVALDRIQKFIEADEMKQQPLRPSASTAISIKDGTFGWGPTAAPLLHNINLEVQSEQLVIVVGSVGAGKSSLLAAVLGEMNARQGQVQVAGSIAYTQQDPWIQNASLRDNILMGTPFHQEKYDRVVQACALLPDLEMLPAGDATEIGEKGVNLSGGQRHRVALARACYADADIYLLDDPLSAVDAHVGRHLFDQCLLSLLGSKTRILVTHQLQYLPAASVVLVVKDGRIAEQGSYTELVNKGIDFHQFEIKSPEKEEESGSDTNEETVVVEDLLEDGESGLVNGQEQGHDENKEQELAVLRHDVLSDSAAELYVEELEEVSLEESSTHTQQICEAAETGGAVQSSPRKSLDTATTKATKAASAAAAATKKAAAAQLTKAEERAVGRVDRQVYSRYFKAWGPRLLVPGFVLALAVTERGLQAAQNWWLSVWTEATSAAEAATADATAAAADTAYYMKVYFALGLISLVFQITRAVTLVLGSIAAARRLQSSLLSTVLRLPMSFFDSQPTGRLLNRFTKDTESVDTSIQSSVASFLNCAVSVLWSLIVVIAVSPGVAVALVPLGLAYSAVQKRFIATSRELKRLDSLALSPIFSHFAETLAGLATLRAFRAQERFASRDAQLLNESNRCYWPAQCVNRWLSVRLELLGIGVVFGTAVFVSAVAPVSAGLAGLAVTSALNLTGLMNWMVRQTTELEVNMNSVERMIEYDSQPSEAPEIVPERRPLPDWPSRGAISVQGLVVRYRPELDPVLKGLSFDIRPREKVGVVGRTGCGKSTLMMALYRIVEPSVGRIIIDNIDICTIGLRDLRSRLALVPQDPIIFSGTIRSNLDPFGDASSGGANGDAALWNALERSSLAAAVRAMPGELDAPISEGGGNLSAGQRQLLCMARALLRSARILILDEATSSIDNASDSAVQSTIAAAFADCTVLTIAHRLHTIMHSDRVLVLDAGNVLEFDTPAALMQKPDGAFRALVDQSNSHGKNHT